MINFLHTFQPSPILISLGPINVYWYGLFIVLAILFAILIIFKLADYYNIKKEGIIDLAFYLIIGGIIGARLYHILLEWEYYLSHPLDIIKIWQGGLAIHGAIFAGLIIIWIFAKKNYNNLINNQNNQGNRCNQWSNFWLLTAIITPGLALAQAIGRWGNYFNQELFGKPTDLPWGIPIMPANKIAEYYNYQFFHPAFLYESIGSLLIFFILIFAHIWIIKKQNNIASYKLCTISYLGLYSVLRFITEFIRIDSTYAIIGLRWPQIISLFIILILTIYLFKNYKLIIAKNKTLEQ